MTVKWILFVKRIIYSDKLHLLSKFSILSVNRKSFQKYNKQQTTQYNDFVWLKLLEKFKSVTRWKYPKKKDKLFRLGLFKLKLEKSDSKRKCIWTYINIQQFCLVYV